MSLRKNNCCVCGASVQFFCELNGDKWYKCTICSFLQKEISIETLEQLREDKIAGRGSGFREYSLATMLHQKFGLNKILLVGTGYSYAMEKLLKEEIEDTYYGCDIDSTVLKEKREMFGTDRFFNCMELPHDIKFDGLVIVEVFEHMPFPKETMNYYLTHLSERTIIAISTDFYPGTGYGRLAPRRSYANIPKHVSYWSEKSFSKLGEILQLDTIFFDIEFASIYSNFSKDNNPKTKFPNRRVCFMSNKELYRKLEKFKNECRILPIDRA